ncbi:MAG: ABC transporter ATP-binding protein, partial [Acidobacteriota bacterium]
MDEFENVVDVRGLRHSYGQREAVHGLDLTVASGQCHGFFGRNGAGKTTTIKCLVNHLRPAGGSVRLCGLDPAVDEVAVKARIGYVPDEVAFYPWMTVRKTLDYAASFRQHWNRDLERELLRVRFDLDEKAKVSHLSKGMKAQLALICAVCPEPEVLLLDEPTSGLDPVVRRELLETVIGAYQEGDPAHRTVLVSTHLIAEFEGLIDAFTVIDKGHSLLALDTEEAHRQFKQISLEFEDEPPALAEPWLLRVERHGRE